MVLVQNVEKNVKKTSNMICVQYLEHGWFFSRTKINILTEIGLLEGKDSKIVFETISLTRKTELL